MAEQKKKLTNEQSLVVRLLREREKRQATIVEANELLKEADSQYSEIIELRRKLFQAQVDAISKGNDKLRAKYGLPSGKPNYVTEGDEMYLVEEQTPPEPVVE